MDTCIDHNRSSGTRRIDRAGLTPANVSARAATASGGARPATAGPAAWSAIATALVQQLVAWRAHRRHAARDHADLSSMSERELRDIGLSASDVPHVASGHWDRDCPL